MPSIAEFLKPHPPFPIVAEDDEVQSHYVFSRRQGTSHKMAEMFAFQSAPALETDTRWLSRQLEQQRRDFNADTLEGQTLLAAAREAGIPIDSAVYQPGLADHPNDPRALVESRADCIRRANELNLKLQGPVDYTPPGWSDGPDDGEGEYRVAPDIVEQHYQEAVEAEPALASKKNFKEELTAKLSGQA